MYEIQGISIRRYCKKKIEEIISHSPLLFPVDNVQCAVHPYSHINIYICYMILRTIVKVEKTKEKKNQIKSDIFLPSSALF